MNLLVNAPSFCGTMTAPSSKSHTIRALICASLAESPSFITAPLISGDMESAIQALRQLGVTITEVSHKPLTLKVTPPARGLLSFAEGAVNTGQNSEYSEQGNIPFGHGGKQSGQDEELLLNLGNSGSLLYFLGMILAAAETPVCLTGDESLRSRPAAPLLSIYRQAGISYSAAKPDSDTRSTDVPPLRFCGPLPAGNYQLDGPFSQPVTGLLFTAPLLNGMSRITFNKAGERPYLRMTCDWLRIAGITLTHGGFDTDTCSFEIAGNQRYQPFRTTIPGDWSSALFPLTAAVICNAALTLTNLDPADTQGDSRALSILQAMGADIRCDAERRTVSVFPISGTLRGGRFDCGDIPDAVPILAAAAVFCSGQTLLTNAGVCRFKECDRLAASAEELAKFGAHIVQGENFLRIDGSGGTGLHPAQVRSRGDHRIAMMLAVAACGIAETSCIEDFDCVKISYPRFIEDMNAAGAVFKVQTHQAVCEYPAE
ncbi:3-phosphoshikimate 1-carboxyvinyltransferase [Treponema vincentii]|uniref:3-phosphoshikimate 1-carboxyvinyltransferase n=1 Tax=Treponema vincentii ATCC 35580 TaxID=596324 RepID=C8PST5_9SPIR|nr:3-phosphoshikimate 1-carboxyvinyltransferase [Treponema vincentii]EEV19546.1 3-phosphoshikimate 1-carboxyvinyltransferase [Treponema vincentii ATCC 35580]